MVSIVAVVFVFVVFDSLKINPEIIFHWQEERGYHM